MSVTRIAYVRPALVMTVLLTLATGVAYPLLTTGVSELVFSSQARGSLINDSSDKVIGSELIGQNLPATSTSGAVRQSRPIRRITRWRQRAAIWRPVIRRWIRR